MPSAEFTCQTCGTGFDLAPAAKEKYPNWRPKQCIRCRGGGQPAARRPVFEPPQPRPNDFAAAPAIPVAPPAPPTAEGEARLLAVLQKYNAGPSTGVFTDGACSGNPGPGGWGAVRVEDGKIVAERRGGDPGTTNNRMELMAMIAGLEMIDHDEPFDVYSDSQLVVNTLTKWAKGWEARGWRRKEGEVMNLDLVKRAYALFSERPNVRINWVRAHDGTRWNEYADALSTIALR
ncbi:MAG: ribonuclease H [Dehalococcoidia bacterium]